MDTKPLFRAADWELRLAAYLDRVRDDPFKWGAHDCALFAAGAVNAQTGVDPAQAFRGAYTTRKGAAEALRSIGAGTLLRTADAWFGKQKHVSLAHRGDVVARNHHTLGICVGLYSYFPGEEHGREGLVFLPTADCKRAWSIPFALAEVAR